MPRSRTVLKRQRQTERRRLRNKAVRSRLRTLERRVAAAEGLDPASPQVRELQSTLDRAAAKGIIHPNKAARTKARLAKRISSP